MTEALRVRWTAKSTRRTRRPSGSRMPTWYLVGVGVLAHRGAEAERPLDLLACVVTVEVEVHLVTGSDQCLGPLTREVDPLAPEHPEVVSRVTGARATSSATVQKSVMVSMSAQFATVLPTRMPTRTAVATGSDSCPSVSSMSGATAADQKENWVSAAKRATVAPPGDCRRGRGSDSGHEKLAIGGHETAHWPDFRSW